MKVDMKLIGLENVLKQLDPKAQDTIAMRTVNKVAAQAKTAADTEIRKSYTVKKKDLGLKLYKARKGTPVAVVGAKKRALPLSKFRTRQVSKGVRVEVTKGKPEVREGMFKRGMSTGHTGVFTRVRKGGRRVARLPIGEQLGPGPGRMLEEPRTVWAMRKVQLQKFKGILMHEIEFYFSKRSGKGRKR